MRLLDNFQQLGTQESSGVFVMGGNVDLANTLVDSATRAVDGNPEGEEFVVRIQEAASPANYMTVAASYTLENGDHKLIVENVISSNSVASSLVEFATGQDNLRFFGVVDVDSVNTLLDRIDSTPYQTGFFQDFSDFVITSQAAFSQDGSAVLTVTPKSSDSELVVRYNSNVLVESDVATQNDTRGILSFSYDNGTNFVSFGGASRYGQVVINAGSNREFHYADSNICARFNQSHLNPSGNWVVKIIGSVDFADVTMTVNNTFFDYREQKAN